MINCCGLIECLCMLLFMTTLLLADDSESVDFQFGIVPGTVVSLDVCLGRPNVEAKDYADAIIQGIAT